jgi:hypothetical protein
MPNRLPHVLFIDDLEGVVRNAVNVAFAGKPIDFKLLHPETVESADLAWADLVIVDYFLDDWQERDVVESRARHPVDGLAVVAALRSGLLPGIAERRSGMLPEKPVAFALWSANLPQAAFDLPAFVLPHVFSRENNLEWAFKRNDLLADDGVEKVVALAAGVLQLSEFDWQGMTPSRTLSLLLDVADHVPWADRALESALECRPPIHELASRTKGMSVARWLLHRIFPYPAFLIGEDDLRARLKVDELAPNGQSELLEELTSCRYTGILSGFSGRLWWRVGVEAWIWESSGGSSSSSSVVAELALSKGANRSNRWVTPVTVIDSELARSSELHEIEGVVRVRPDDWPIYADDAYATFQSVGNSQSLLSIVDPDDFHRLPDDVQSPN